MIVTGQKQPERLPTVRVASDETSKGYMIINAADFDAAAHTKHESDPGEAGESFVGQRVASSAESDDVESGAEFPHERRIKTIRVASEETAAGYMIINADDFDPAVHTMHDRADPRERAPADLDVADLSSLSFPALRQLAKRLGVKANGTRAAIESVVLEYVTDPANTERLTGTSGEPGDEENGGHGDEGRE